MHRELPVAVLGVNDISGTVYRVDEVFHVEHLPLGTPGRTKKETAKNLNAWLSGRMIPASRSGFQQAMQAAMLQKNTEVSASILLLKCYGLSLSDQYWLNPAAAPLQWREINFYNNPFSNDVGDLLFGDDDLIGLHIIRHDPIQFHIQLTYKVHVRVPAIPVGWSYYIIGGLCAQPPHQKAPGHMVRGS